MHRTVGRPAAGTDRYGDPEVTKMRGAWVQRTHGRRVAYDSDFGRRRLRHDVCPCTVNDDRLRFVMFLTRVPSTICHCFMIAVTKSK